MVLATSSTNSIFNASFPTNELNSPRLGFIKYTPSLTACFNASPDVSTINLAFFFLAITAILAKISVGTPFGKLPLATIYSAPFIFSMAVKHSFHSCSRICGPGIPKRYCWLKAVCTTVKFSLVLPAVSITMDATDSFMSNSVNAFPVYPPAR